MTVLLFTGIPADFDGCGFRIGAAAYDECFLLLGFLCLPIRF